VSVSECVCSCQYVCVCESGCKCVGVCVTIIVFADSCLQLCCVHASTVYHARCVRVYENILLKITFIFVYIYIRWPRSMTD